ncbi:hypothetical protein [Burkholderia vietnamiensis]|uniref:hypothetical protein n=1 Tax=Burkholderia vietnamiensis TaxID=60552 RepID=UPI001B9EE18A|nr:hypothetical protein [Burkholderia vietnamiensis]MBR8005616.1 hypothetical protein [Burkholderia vietnamiensis]
MSTDAKPKLTDDDSQFVLSLFKESERAAVILAIAQIDVELERLLKALLLPCAGGQDTLFDSDRALGTFSAKILIAHRLGLIDHEFERGLQILRRMRNEFAHHVADATLSKGGHRDRLTELVRWARKNKKFDSVFEQTKVQWPDVNEHHREFVLAVLATVAALKRGQLKIDRINIGKPISIGEQIKP